APSPTPCAASGLVLILEARVQDVGILEVDVEADPPDAAGREAATQTRPRLATVGRLVDAGARAAVDDLPRLPFLVVGRGVENRRILRVHHEIDHTDFRADVEDLLPGCATVGRPENAA